MAADRTDREERAAGSPSADAEAFAGRPDVSDLPSILDAAQVAELLGMNVQMVRKYAREGRLPAYRLPGGRTFRFFRDEVVAFLREHPVRPDG